ncbi:MAG: signal peptidase I [Sporichthyaceae bacterium]
MNSEVAGVVPPNDTALGRLDQMLVERPRSHRRTTAPEVDATPSTRALLRAARKRRMRRIQAIAVLAVLGAMLVVRGAMFQAFSIPSPSMQPALDVNDRVLVNKLSYAAGEVQRGQVVVFDGRGSFIAAGSSPGLWDRLLGAIGFSGDDEHFVKRVIGIPGDRVVCCDSAGKLQINGISLDEPYLFGTDLPSTEKFDIEVPPGRVWMMGDHRSRSADSRAHLGAPGGGTVPMDKIVGRAIAIVWPPGRWTRLPIPPSFDPLTTNGAPQRD